MARDDERNRIRTARATYRSGTAPEQLRELTVSSRASAGDGCDRIPYPLLKRRASCGVRQVEGVLRITQISVQLCASFARQRIRGCDASRIHWQIVDAYDTTLGCAKTDMREGGRHDCAIRFGAGCHDGSRLMKSRVLLSLSCPPAS